MQLYELKPKHKLKKKKRVGRGGKRGTYSGRGIKGQRARAGRAPRPALRDIVKKFHKKRGYRFKSIKEEPIILNLGFLAEKFEDKDIVTMKTLYKKKLLRKKDKVVKILGDGELNIKLFFEGRKDLLKFSHAALEKIKKAGGRVKLTAKKRPTLPKAERKKVKSITKKNIEPKREKRDETESTGKKKRPVKKTPKQAKAKAKVSAEKKPKKGTAKKTVVEKEGKEKKETKKISIEKVTKEKKTERKKK